jgi:DNA ligase D-like protein (predicted 3'-phosphoesterase)
VTEPEAKRILVSGDVSELALRERVSARAAQLGVSGWVRLTEEGTLCTHVEGAPSAIRDLATWLASIEGTEAVAESSVSVEGHEQFIVRGIPAGVDGVMRSWAVPKGPSLDPAVKRLAVQVEDHTLAHNTFEGRTGSGAVIVWDRGAYEQGGRVSWPEALTRGHAVFVLHGEKLQGGFALQRTGGGAKPQWLLIKRRDEHAKPGFDVVAEQSRSVQSGLTLGELLGG